MKSSKCKQVAEEYIVMFTALVGFLLFTFLFNGFLIIFTVMCLLGQTQSQR